MGDAKYYRCKDCGYEFLAKSASPNCPSCKSNEPEDKNLRTLAGMDH